MSAYAKVQINFTGGFATKTEILTFIASCNRKSGGNIYFDIRIVKSKTKEIELRIEGVGERNACWQIDQLVDYCRTNPKILSLTSEVWILGEGSEYHKGE